MGLYDYTHIALWNSCRTTVFRLKGKYSELNIHYIKNQRFHEYHMVLINMTGTGIIPLKVSRISEVLVYLPL
mgnify:FL=1